MTANTNPETGIRYGVVAMNSLESWVWDEFYTSGTNESEIEALREWHEENPPETLHDPEEAENQFFESLEIEEPTWSLEQGGMRLEIGWLGGAPLLWVLLSPHTTEARECSPCVPNAGNLDCKETGGFTCYDLPAEWYATSHAD